MAIAATPGLIGKCFYKIQVGFKKVIRRGEDIPPSLAGFIKTAPDFFPGIFRGTACEEMKLVKPPDHTYLFTYALFGFLELGIPTHSRRSKGLHGIGIHGSNIFQDGHHASTGMVSNPLQSDLSHRVPQPH